MHCVNIQCRMTQVHQPRPIPLKSHRSGVFGDVRITSGGRDLSECADLSDRAGRAPAVVKR